MRIVFIGAGNLATHLSRAFAEAGHQIIQVYSRTEESACLLAAGFGCPWTNDLQQVSCEGQLYVFSLRDLVLQEIANSVYDHLRRIARPGNPDSGANALFIHTAGSISLDVLPTLRRGVLYPMQTFSKCKPVSFRDIPVFVESQTDQALLLDLARGISEDVHVLDSESRRSLHVAAVFACNFVNHMYDLSSRLLQERGIPFSVMLPLIDETAAKVHSLAPCEAQTGPAVRYDQNVINRHLSLIQDPTMHEIYELLSKSIHDKLRSHKN